MNKDYNISNDNEDLEGMAPKLARVDARNPFNAGPDYFDKFSAKLQNRIDQLEEIKKIAPVLSSIPKYNPFKVPDNYFEELPTLMQERVIVNKGNKAPLEWLILLIKPRFVIPMLATLLIAVAGINYMNKHAVTSKTEATEELSLEEHLYYIDENAIIETLTADAGIENGSISDDENSIENYLIENDIDETNLEL